MDAAMSNVLNHIRTGSTHVFYDRQKLDAMKLTADKDAKKIIRRVEDYILRSHVDRFQFGSRTGTQPRRNTQVRLMIQKVHNMPTFGVRIKDPRFGTDGRHPTKKMTEGRTR